MKNNKSLAPEKKRVAKLLLLVIILMNENRTKTSSISYFTNLFFCIFYCFDRFFGKVSRFFIIQFFTLTFDFFQ